jgi:hypothetical protein
MNVILKPQAAPATKPEFPVLMEYVGPSELSKGGVVLFLGRKEGIAMKGMAAAQIGTVEKDWVVYDDKSVWLKYTGVVELSN